MNHNHKAIYMHQNQKIHDAITALEIANLVPFSMLKGAVFSIQMIKEYIKEELLHESVIIARDSNRYLSTMSSGQQSKAVLLYLLSQDHDYLILDNVFSFLDKKNIVELKEIITQYCTKICFIQFTYRKGDIFDWIKDRYYLEETDTIKLKKIQEVLEITTGQNLFNIKKIFSTQPKPSLDNNPLIEFKNINVKYGENEVFNNFSWKVNQGDFWQISGPNGSGKSTLLSMIFGDNVKAYGQNVFLFGKKKGSGESVWEIKRKIGYYAASTTALHHRSDTIQEMIMGGLYDSIGLYRVPSQMDQKKSMAWIEALNLVDLKDKPFKDQTSGIQGIVMVARAMIKEPILLILDEPAAGLDDENARLLTDLIRAIAKTRQTTILYVSHREEVGLQAEYNLQLDYLIPK